MSEGKSRVFGHCSGMAWHWHGMGGAWQWIWWPQMAVCWHGNGSPGSLLDCGLVTCDMARQIQARTV